ncbi:MAG: hypothetical protein OXI13_06360 [Gammaproteobacteria bacterium]|nr:hypothetical protein [Gammaproteobacteria bacterium]
MGQTLFLIFVFLATGIVGGLIGARIQQTMPQNGSVSADEVREQRKSWVRIIVTYGAAAFLFVGGAAFIFDLIRNGKNDEAMTLFNTILPVSAAIISYWFAGRKDNSQPGRNKSDDQQAGE